MNIFPLQNISNPVEAEQICFFSSFCELKVQGIDLKMWKQSCQFECDLQSLYSYVAHKMRTKLESMGTFVNTGTPVEKILVLFSEPSNPVIVLAW